MPNDEDDDLYNDEFDFVDDDDDFDGEGDFVDDEEDEVDDEAPEEKEPVEKKPARKRPAKKAAKKPAKKKPATKRKTAKKTTKKATSADDVEEDASFGAGLVDDEEPAATDEQDNAEAESDEKLDEFGRPEPVANYVVHIYEHGDLKRTIDRDFTPEDAEAFATDYSKTAKAYGRVAVAGKKESTPAKQLVP